MEVGEVLQFYDSDRRFPAWGFGGKTLDGVVSHCFNLNGSPNGVEVKLMQLCIHIVGRITTGVLVTQLLLCLWKLNSPGHMFNISCE